jgi:hypothetical protein
LPDFLDFDKYIDNDLMIVNKLDIPDRVNKEHVVDIHGRRLLDVCISTGLILTIGSSKDFLALDANWPRSILKIRGKWANCKLHGTLKYF